MLHMNEHYILSQLLIFGTFSYPHCMNADDLVQIYVTDSDLEEFQPEQASSLPLHELPVTILHEVLSSLIATDSTLK